MDFSDLNALQAEIYAALSTLEKLGDEYAVARQVVDHDGDMRRNLLARYKAKETPKSDAEKEMLARSRPEYLVETTEHEKRIVAAYKVINRHWFLNSKLDALRSILSTQKVLSQL